MKPCEPYLYEFLWRGRAPGDETPAAWHVQIETRVAVGGNHVVPHVRTLNVQDAIKEGWDLKKIAAAIDTETLAEVESLRGRVLELEKERATIVDVNDMQRSVIENYEANATQLREALADRAAAADRHALERDQAHSEIRRLAAVVDEQTAVVKDLQAKIPKKPKPRVTLWTRNRARR